MVGRHWEAAMMKLILAIAFVFILGVGAVAVLHPQPVLAANCSTSDC
jgi:hypothetical protein